MNDNKELNTLLDKLFNSVKNTYDISAMIRDIKKREINVSGAEFKEELKDKEVSDKDYEVLTFGHSLDNNGYFKEIKKVKRLNDSEVFVTGQNTDEGIIKSFYESENILWVRFEEKGGVVSINDIQKVVERNVLFVSEDGVKVREGDKVYVVRHESDWGIHEWNNVEPTGYVPFFKYFWNIGKAKEYASKHKKHFFVNTYTWQQGVCSFEETKNGDDKIKFFDTEDKAVEFLNYNKPRYSYQDILNWIEPIYINSERWTKLYNLNNQ